MTGDLDDGIRQAPGNVNRQIIPQQRKGAARAKAVRDNPFDRQDVLVLTTSVALVVLAAWCFAPD